MTKLFPPESPSSPPSSVINLSNIEPSIVLSSIKNRVKGLLDEQTYDAWIAPLELDHNSDEFTVLLPNLVFYQGFHAEFLPLLEQVKQDLGFGEISIKYDVSGSSVDVYPSHADDIHYQETPSFKDEDQKSGPVSPLGLESMRVKSSNDEAENNSKKKAFSRSLTTDGNLNPAYTFDTFVKGDSNQFAVATCLSAAENPGKSYNPLFIYGSTGLGKTHLLHAVGNRVLQFNKNAVVTYISSEHFMNEMIYCIRHNRTFDFRRKYRNCDVLMVDDIQFISGRKATQEEFFHTFNALYGAKKQIVITSDLFPKDIPDIEDRLRNRFQWGLIADIQAPSIEHRIAILLSKAEELGISLTEDVAEYIAKHAKKNVRELEGALHRINAFATLQGESISMDLAIRTFKDVLGEPPKRITIETIQKTVADHFKLRVQDLKSKRRQRAFAHPRQIAMYLSRQLTNASFPEIGGKFGGKDHTTVMHNVKKIVDTIEKDLDLKAHIETLERLLEQQN